MAAVADIPCSFRYTSIHDSGILIFMPRRPEPEGRRNTVCTKLSDSELETITAARGSEELSEWARRILLAAADRPAPAAPQPSRGKCPHRLPSGAYCKTCDK